MEVGERVHLEITRLDPEMRGLAWVDGVALTVPGATPGDRVRCEIDHASPHRPQAWGRVLEAERRGPSFREPPCPHAAPIRGRCGGCAALHLDEAAQRARKRETLAQCLAAIDYLAPVEPCPAPLPLGYRNRSNYAVVYESNDRPNLGGFAPRSHDFVAIPGCLSVRPAIADAAARILELLGTLGAPQPLRWVSVRTNHQDHMLVELVTGGEAAPGLDPGLDPRLIQGLAALDGVAGVASSSHPGEGNAVRLGPARSLAGAATLPLLFAGLRFGLGPSTFFQLNFPVAEAMAERCAEWAGAVGHLVELYAGIGALGQTVLARAGSGTLDGFESLDESVALARDAALTNGVAARYQVADLRRGCPSLAADLVIANPPRRGLDAPVLAQLALDRPPRLLYMSCDPEAFARDARQLRAQGLVLAEVAAFDMLPQTPHVELLGRFVRV